MTVNVASNVATATSVTIPEKVMWGDAEYTVVGISDDGFAESSLVSVTIEAPNLAIGKSAFSGSASLATVELSGSGSISSIGESAFSDCTSLKSITLSEGIESIPSMAFYDCPALDYVVFPSSLTSIGESAFAVCDSLTFPSFPVNLKSIGSNAFQDCLGITSVFIPKGVKEIGSTCFEGCTNLETFVIEDGTALRSIGQIFAGKSCGVKTIVIGDGVETIAESAFSSLSSLESLTLPKTVALFENNILSGCNNLTTIRCYAVTPPEFYSGAFNDIKTTSDTVNIYVPNASLDSYKTGSEWATASSDTKFEFHGLYSFAVDGNTVTIKTTQDFTDLFAALSDENSGYSSANINFAEELTFEPNFIELESLSADNIHNVMEKLPTVASSFNGSMNDAIINNLSVRSSGLFSTIGVDAEINGLALNNATIYVDLNDSDSYFEENDTIFIPLLAKSINGSVNNFSFTGSIIIDEDSPVIKGKTISVCLAKDAGEDASINGIFRIDEVFAMGVNKRCITIKQNLGVRNSKTAKIKMARQKLRQAGGNKSLDGDEFAYTTEELNKMVREFDDNEFASGVVAYWLNYEGAGYTGNYSARWSQGKAVPVAATVRNGVTNALYAVDYGVTDMEHITSGKRFANNGSLISITYDERPASIMQGTTKIINYRDESVTLTFDHNKSINMNFGGQSPTATLSSPASKVSISVFGRSVVISGADGELKTLYSLTGAPVTSSVNNSLVAPASGLYIVRVGKNSAKVIVR